MNKNLDWYELSVWILNIFYMNGRFWCVKMFFFRNWIISEIWLFYEFLEFSKSKINKLLEFFQFKKPKFGFKN